MSLSRATFLLSCYMLFSITLQAQQSPPTSIVPTSDPQAVAVVQRAVAALTRGATVSDVTLTGSAHRTAGSDDEMGTTTVTGTALGDSKVSLNFPSGPRTEIRNHSATPLPVSLPAGVTLAAAATQPQPVDVWSGADGVVYSMAQNVMTDPTWFFPAITLGKIAASPTWVLSYVGPETHDGISVVHVQAAQLIPAVQMSSATRRYRSQADPHRPLPRLEHAFPRRARVQHTPSRERPNRYSHRDSLL